MKKELIEFLAQFVKPERFSLFAQNIKNRTRYLSVALEDIYQPHNASAVLRTCDCFGVQDVHIVENQNEYVINPDVALGASKWLCLHRHNQQENNTLQAIEQLRKQNYRIVATTPHTNDMALEEFDLEKGKIALFFGTEMRGLSSKVLDNADEFLKIPMVGFTESFNISVSAAIALHHLTWRLRNSALPWQLSEQERDEILLDWLKKSIRNPEALVAEFENRRKK